MKTETYIIPDFYLAALFNGDSSGLSDEDEKALDSFVETEMKPKRRFNAIDTGQGLGFLRYHDLEPYGVLACDCVEVIFDVGAA